MKETIAKLQVMFDLLRDCHFKCVAKVAFILNCGNITLLPVGIIFVLYVGAGVSFERVSPYVIVQTSPQCWDYRHVTWMMWYRGLNLGPHVLSTLPTELGLYAHSLHPLLTPHIIT